MKLHLGVVNIPYASAGGQTTGGVARILESKYGVMGAFMRKHGDSVRDAITESRLGVLRNALIGHNSGSPYAAACDDIKDEFQRFLTNSEIEGMGIEGVPTWAAYSGQTHRFKGKLNKGKGRRVVKDTKRWGVRRPSFVDTGLYRASFIAWVD